MKCLPRYACFHRMHDGRIIHNGYAHAPTPRDALAVFKVLTPTAGNHFVVIERTP